MRGLTLRRAVTLVTAASLALGGCTGGEGDQAAKGSKKAPTAWSRVVAGIADDGLVDKTTALRAFSLAVMPLPGVKIPSGRRTPLLSGSGSIRWLFGHWDDLSASQRKAVTDRLGRDPFAAPVSGTGPNHKLAASSGTVRRIAVGDSPGAGPYRARLDTYLAAIGAKLVPPHTLDIPTRVVMDQKQVGDGDAYTYALGPKQGHVTECEIHVTPRLPKLSPTDVDVAMAHEAFHCLQSDLFPTVQDGDDTLTASPWIVEGQAAWVGEEVAGPDTGQYAEDWWKAYLLTPRTPLTKRDYDAIGFYSHLAETGNDPWKVLVPMLTAGGNATAFQIATSAARDPFLTSWPSGIFRRQAWGAAWDTSGPGIPGPGVRGPVQVLDVAEGKSAKVSTDAFANELSEIDSSAEVTLVGTDGYARIRDEGALDVVAQLGIEVALCTRKDAKCACPDEGGPPLTPARSPLQMGTTGGSKAATATIAGQSLSQYCKARKKKKPSREAWCAEVIRVNRKYGYLVGNPPRYLPPDKLTLEMLRGITEETLAHEQDLLDVTPREILAAQQNELRALHEFQAAGYDLAAVKAGPAGLVETQKQLLAYQVQNCAILPPPK